MRTVAAVLALVTCVHLGLWPENTAIAHQLATMAISLEDWKCVVETLEPFVFDGGSLVAGSGGCGCLSSGSGGSDVFQEWGVVRGSLAQKLVLPGFGRTVGAFNSNWTTDVTFYNPNETAITATLRFVRGDSATVATASNGDQTIELAPREIRHNCQNANREVLRRKQQEIAQRLFEARKSGKVAEEALLNNQFEQILRLGRMA